MFKIRSFRNDGSYVTEHEYKSFTFNAGEIHPTIDVSNIDFPHQGIVEISARISSGNDIVELLNIKNIVDKHFQFHTKILKLYYTMFSRQDRAANIGESESLKVFCNLINSMKFDKVITVDNHSEVTNALLNNNDEISQLEIIKKIFPAKQLNHTKMNYDYIISPDAGANKKASAIARYFNIEMIQADKVRCTVTGEITGTVVHASDTDLGGSRVLIVDDICDGGRTVIEIAKVLKQKETDIVECYFTHGIFSKGTEVLYDAKIDHMFTTNSFKQEVNDKLTVYHL